MGMDPQTWQPHVVQAKLIKEERHGDGDDAFIDDEHEQVAYDGRGAEILRSRQDGELIER